MGSVWRVLIVERQPVITPEIRDRLTRDARFATVGRCDSAAGATRIVRDTPVDLTLVESTMPPPGAIELARFFKVRHAKTVIAFVTRAASQTELFEAGAWAWRHTCAPAQSPKPS